MTILDLSNVEPQTGSPGIMPDGTLALCLVRVRAPNPHANEWLRRSKMSDNQYLDLELVTLAPQLYQRARVYERMILVGSPDAVQMGKQMLRAALESIAALATGATQTKLTFSSWAEVGHALHDKIVAIRVRHGKSAREDGRPDIRAVFLTPSAGESAADFQRAAQQLEQARAALPAVRAAIAGGAASVPPAQAAQIMPAFVPQPTQATAPFQPSAVSHPAAAAQPAAFPPAQGPTFGQPIGIPDAPQAPGVAPAAAPVAGWPGVQTTWRP